MNDREKQILEKICTIFPRLNPENQKYVLGIAEGMAMVRAEERKQEDAVCAS